MINIIVCDDDNDFLIDLINFIKQFFKKKGLKFKIHAFNNYDDKFISIINNDELENKIYILDIETPKGNGINIARMIRNNDLNSLLIYISGYTEKYLRTVSKGDTMFMGYISKSEDYKHQLQTSLSRILKVGFKIQVIRFKDQGCNFTLDLREINYIDTNTEQRKIVIHTISNTIPINKTLKEFMSLLDYRFEYSHRGCIINRENVLYIDTVVKIIRFKNSDTTTQLSPDFIKNERNKNKTNINN